MSVIGLRVGPFEIVEPATVPEAGDWFRAHRAGLTQRKPNKVLVRLLGPTASEAERGDLQRQFDRLRAVEDDRVPKAVALYEGIGALAVVAPDGVSFQDIIDARQAGTITMTPATLLDLALDVAECLQHAHHRTHHHGHLAAEHIRLSTSGKVFVFGFGPGPETPCTLGWLSPERARGEPTSDLTDQWALAAILSGLITGQTPWHGGREPVLGDMTPAADAVERQWPALARLFRRMLESDPANRFPTMHPVRQELLALARKAGATSNRRELGKSMARRIDRAITPDTEIAPVPSPTSPPEAPPVTFPPRDPADPPSIPDAERAEATPPLARPLTNEPIDVVAPEADASTLAQARRPLDVVQPPVEEEDVDDDPTVRFDPMLAKKMAAALAEPTPEPSPERLPEMEAPIDPPFEEETADPETLARALAIAPDDAFGGMPTAVPITDVEDLPEDQIDTEAVKVSGLDAFTSAPITPVDVDVVDLEGSAAPTPKSAPDVRKLAPLLVGLMILLMLAVVVASLT